MSKTMEIHLPDEVAHYEPELRLFFDLMITKLHLNRTKGYIEGKSLTDLYAALMNELGELQEAHENRGSVNKNASQFDYALECVDLSNQSFLLALAVLRKTKEDYENE